VTDSGTVRLLTALLQTVSPTQVPLFWETVGRFVDMDATQDGLSLLTWAVYFPPPTLDDSAVSVRVFAVMSGLVGLSDPPPLCPCCGSATVFTEDVGDVFGWSYRCNRGQQYVSRAEARKRHIKRSRQCKGNVSATANTWFDGSKSVYRSLSLMFCWLARLPVTSAVDAAKSSSGTAVDHYSMAREICEVVMSNELLNRQFGGPGVEVEVDECFLTRRKYHKGRRMKTGTVTLLGVYERATDLGCHVQVRDRSSAILISEIERIVAPGTRIISDALRSYRRLPEHGYDHSYVVHDVEFVDSTDTSVHTQNVEVRNRWTKAAIKSYRKNRPLNSYCAEYSYRLYNASTHDDVLLA